MSHTTHETALLKMFYRHLPDITLITPVFDANSKEIIFFTASRGHHADIGGILPGSMPPTSVNIFEEGAEIMSFKIVDGGLFDQKGLVEYMVEKPSQYPGSSGCRNIRDVESDLKAVSPIVTSSRGLVLTFNQANCGKSQRNTVDSCQYAIFFYSLSLPNYSSSTQLWKIMDSRLYKSTCTISVPMLRCRLGISFATLPKGLGRTSLLLSTT